MTQPNELQVVAWLVNDGRVFKDSAYVAKVFADESVSIRKDGSKVEPLVLASEAQALQSKANGWDRVIQKWEQHPGFKAVAEEHSQDGNYSAASILNDWIARLLEAQARIQELENSAKHPRDTATCLLVVDRLDAVFERMLKTGRADNFMTLSHNARLDIQELRALLLDTQPSPAKTLGPNIPESVAQARSDALAELIASKDAHQEACVQWGRDNPPTPMGDIRSYFSTAGLNFPPTPTIDTAVARLNAAWAAARAAMGEDSK